MVEKKSILSAHSVASKGSSNTLLPMPKWLPKTFDSLICNNGYHAFIEHALRCPCCDRGNGQALSTCRNCMGRGWMFVDKKETTVISQSMANIRRNSDIGEVNRGTARITTRAADKIGFMDRIIFDELLAWYSEILRPTEIDDELVAYPIYEPLDVSNIYLFISDSEKLRPLKKEEYEIIGNKIIFDKSLEEEVEVDSVNAKTVPLSISIRYSYYPVYHIIDVNRELMRVRDSKCGALSNGQLEDMPISAEARKAHFIFDAQIYGREIFDNTVLDKEE